MLTKQQCTELRLPGWGLWRTRTGSEQHHVYQVWQTGDDITLFSSRTFSVKPWGDVSVLYASCDPLQTRRNQQLLLPNWLQPEVEQKGPITQRYNAGNMRVGWLGHSEWTSKRPTKQCVKGAQPADHQRGFCAATVLNWRTLQVTQDVLSLHLQSLKTNTSVYQNWWHVTEVTGGNSVAKGRQGRCVLGLYN